MGRKSREKQERANPQSEHWQAKKTAFFAQFFEPASPRTALEEAFVKRYALVRVKRRGGFLRHRGDERFYFCWPLTAGGYGFKAADGLPPTLKPF